MIRGWNVSAIYIHIFYDNWLSIDKHVKTIYMLPYSRNIYNLRRTQDIRPDFGLNFTRVNVT